MRYVQTEKVCDALFKEDWSTNFRRLRCDRQEPCSNCSSRGVSCSYTSSPQPKSFAKEQKQVNNSLERIRRLEQLVASLTPTPQEASQVPPIATARSGSSPHTDAISSQSFAHADRGISSYQELPRDKTPSHMGRMEVNSSHTVYLSAAHWTTISDEVRHGDHACVLHSVTCRY